MLIKISIVKMKLQLCLRNVIYALIFPNCYYKQLQKSKEQNENLKQYLLNIGMIIEEFEQQYNDIKDFTEIKEIKEILNEVNHGNKNDK